MKMSFHVLLNSAWTVSQINQCKTPDTVSSFLGPIKEVSWTEIVIWQKYRELSSVKCYCAIISEICSYLAQYLFHKNVMNIEGAHYNVIQHCEKRILNLKNVSSDKVKWVKLSYCAIVLNEHLMREFHTCNRVSV